MKRELKITGDGSPTLYVPELDEHYHSVHGAIQESMHVFIENGFNQFDVEQQPLQILEIGLGTGLNVLLTLNENLQACFDVNYHALEPFPIEKELISLLNFQIPELSYSKAMLELIHNSDEDKIIQLGERFNFKKTIIKLEDQIFDQHYHLIYFDAFGPRVQPEIWSLENFKKLFDAMEPGGILVTYCSKGDVRRTMLNAGFLVEKLKGPPGKREMLRAQKLSNST